MGPKRSYPQAFEWVFVMFMFYVFLNGFCMYFINDVVDVLVWIF